MRYVTSSEYDEEHDFSIQELGRITPHDVYRWLAFKAYGNEDPGPDDKPTRARSDSLMYWKKALSYFMPNRISPWNVLANPPSGNPTRSKEVNDLIKAVKKKETRKQGKKSKSDRPFEKAEYSQAIRLLQSHADTDRRYRYTTPLYAGHYEVV